MRPLGPPALACLGAALLSASARATEASRADDPGSADEDATYGRIDGDLGVSAGAGATFGPRAPRAALDLRLRYLDTAGVFVSYEDGLSATAADPRRVFAGGFEVRPLFLARWLSGRESGAPRVDLFIDSLGLEIGAFLEQPVGAGFLSRPGLQASLGVEIPILPHATGPYIGLHGGARWSDATLEGSDPTQPVDRALFLQLTLAYHLQIAAHLVDVRDAAPR
jgi:hypothetical protein